MSVPAHTPSRESRAFHWPDEAACAAFARQLAALPRLWPSTFISLDGELGAGKTSFVRHLLRALGVQGPIKSPTYAVLEPHALPATDATPARAVAHFDFFRFADPREWEDAGFRDLFASPGLKLAEWPEKAGAQLPTADLVVRIEVRADDTRDVTLMAQTPAGLELLQ